MKNQVVKKMVAIMLTGVMTFGLMACGTSESGGEVSESSSGEAAETSGEDSNETAEGTSGETPTDMEALKEILEGKTISWMTAQGKYFEEQGLMAEYIEETYGCTVDFQISPDDEFFTLLKVKLSTGEVPDVFEYNLPLQNRELGVVENCVDLSNEPWNKQLINPEVAADPDDGKMYALPASSTGGMIAAFYNADVLEECGIVDPNPKTYDEFLEILDTVAEKGNGVTPLYQTNAAAWTTQVFMTAGIPIMMDDPTTTFEQALSGEVAITEIPEYEEALTLYKGLIDAGYVNEDHLSVDYETAAEAIGTGEAAIYIINNGFATDVSAKYPELNLGSFVIPYDDKDVLSTAGLVQGLFVPSQGGQIDVTKAFLQAWSTPECQQIYFDSLGGYPAFEGVDGGEIVPALKSLYDEYITTGKTEIQANDYLADTSALQPELFTFYVSVAAGISTPADAVADFERIFNDYQNQQGVEGF